MTDLLAVLQGFYAERLAMLQRHQASARLIGQYDVNNTYQYIINRGETHLGWVASAITQQGGTLAAEAEPGGSRAGAGIVSAAQVLEADAKDAQAFVDRWRPRVEAIGNARQAKMLGVVLGEVLEQRRFFEQALAGRTDLLGRRAAHLGPAQGTVLNSRWIE